MLIKTHSGACSAVRAQKFRTNQGLGTLSLNVRKTLDIFLRRTSFRDKLSTVYNCVASWLEIATRR